MMLKNNIARTTFRLLAILALSVMPILSMENPGAQIPAPPQLNPEERAQLRQFADELANDLEGLRAEAGGIDAEVAPLRQEVDEMLERLDASDMGWFEDFRKEILCEFPLGDRMSLTLSGADIFKTLFLALHGGCDYMLYKNLSAYYIKNAVYNFETKKEMLVTLLVQAQENNADSEAIDALVTEEFSTIFTFEKVLNSKMLLQLAQYLLSSETAKYLEHSVFPPHQGGLISWFKRNARQQEERRRRNGGRERVEFSCFAILRFMSAYSHGAFSVIEEQVPSIRRTLLRMTGWHHEAMDTNAFYLAKRILILLRFLKQSNEFYTKKCQDFVKKNSERLALLIGQMAHTQDDLSTPKNEAEERLKKLINEAHDVAFFDWVRFKHSCCAWTDLWIESVLLLPMWYEAGKHVYRQMQ